MNKINKNHIHMDEIINQSTKILSSLKYLNPGTTTEAELEILNKSKFQIKRISEDRNITCYGIYFILPESIHNSFQKAIPDVEAHLWKKATLLFNYFPKTKLLELKILESCENLSPEDK